MNRGSGCLEAVEDFAATVFSHAPRNFVSIRRLSLRLHSLERGFMMDKEHVKGVVDHAKGSIKEAAGKVTGDKKLEAEGHVDKAKGEIHKAAGDMKDAAKH